MLKYSIQGIRFLCFRPLKLQAHLQLSGKPSRQQPLDQTGDERLPAHGPAMLCNKRPVVTTIDVHISGAAYGLPKPDSTYVGYVWGRIYYVVLESLCKQTSTTKSMKLGRVGVHPSYAKTFQGGSMPSLRRGRTMTTRCNKPLKLNSSEGRNPHCSSTVARLAWAKPTKKW